VIFEKKILSNLSRRRKFEVDTNLSVPRPRGKSRVSWGSKWPAKKYWHLEICKGAKFRLTSNLWTAIGLTNGAKGVVHRIIYAEGSKPPELPAAVIGTFKHYIGLRWKGMEKEVPIGLVSRKIFSGLKDSTWGMLSILLGYALSVHKLQRDTVDKVIPNPGKTEFALGLLLVGATRCLFFSPMQKYYSQKIELITFWVWTKMMCQVGL
jgi:hypothetical protein